MTIREIKKRSGPPVLSCVVCNLTQIQIGNLRDWMAVSSGHVCAKAACRDTLGLPRFVPPDEKR